MKQINRTDTVGFFEKSSCIVGYDVATQTQQIGEKRYHLLCSETPETPTLQAMASISCSIWGREIIYIEPDAHLLNVHYQALVRTMRAPGDNAQPFFQGLIQFTRNILHSANQEVIATINANPANPQIQLVGEGPATIPAVNLEHFILANTGWCRHHAMLNWYFLQRLRREGHLPPGQVIHYRCVMANGVPHALVVFVNREQETLHVIDSALNHALTLPYEHDPCQRHYGEAFYQTICERYLPDFNDCALTQRLSVEGENEDAEEAVSGRMLISRSS